MLTDLKIESDKNLKEYHTFGVEARARYFISVQSKQELQAILAEPRFKNVKKFILGGGSNVLFVNDFDGLVINMDIKGIEKIKEGDDYVIIKSGAGVIWHDLVKYCVDKNWGGIENLSLIPGTVGAAPIQNIGAYGVELVDVFESAEAVEVKSAEVMTFEKEDCEFGYRDSVFKGRLKGQYFITSVQLRLSKNPKLNTEYGSLRTKLREKSIDSPTIKDVSDTVIEIRTEKLPDPEEIGNAGSFFKNPEVYKEQYDELKSRFPTIPGYPTTDNKIKVPAGWLIEKAGWKGSRDGQTGTYKNQALVIVNHGGATGEEILEFATKIKNSVLEKFGIPLTPEVNLIE